MDLLQHCASTRVSSQAVTHRRLERTLVDVRAVRFLTGLLALLLFTCITTRCRLCSSLLGLSLRLGGRCLGGDSRGRSLGSSGSGLIGVEKRVNTRENAFNKQP